MKFLIYLSVLSLVTIRLKAQTSLISDLVDPSQQNEDLLYNNSSTFVGSRFLFDEFNVGKIYLYDGRVFEDLVLRFNVFDNLIHFKVLNSAKESIVKNARISRFSFYVPKEGVSYDFIKLETTFYQVIFEDDTYSVLKQHQKKLAQAEQANGYNNVRNETKDRLLDDHSYYLRDMHSNTLTRFSLKRKELFPLLIEKGIFNSKDQIKETIKSARMEPNSDEGIRELLEMSNLKQ